jgi:pimeloyl-ACP methyl ester carboxylesterase
LAFGGGRLPRHRRPPRGIDRSSAPLSSLRHAALQTDADDTQALIRRLKLGKIHLLGHTAGNRIARVLAAQHPEIIQTMILCAAGGGTPSPRVLQGLRTVTNPNAIAAQIRTTRKAIFCAPHSEPRPWYLGWYRSAASRSWPAASASTSRRSRPADGPRY